MSRPLQTVLLLLLTTLGAGCIDPFGHCGPTYTDLQWNQAGLYDAAPLSQAWQAEWDPGQGALPWSNPWSDLRSLRLSSLQLDLPAPVYHTAGNVAYSDPHVVAIELVRDGVARAQVEGDVADPVVAAAFRQMADNVSLASDQDLDEAAQRFLASRHDAGLRSAIPLDAEGTRFEERAHWVHEVRVPGPLRLDALAEALGLEAPTGEQPGRASATAGEWSFRFTLPTWTLLDRATEEKLVLDERGWSTYGAGDKSPSSEAELKQAAQDFATRLGLQPLALDEAESSAYIC